MYQYRSSKIPIIVNAIKIHHAVRLMSWRRLAATAIPGMNNANELMASRIAAPLNISASSIVAATDTTMENKVQYQYSDRLDLVLKSKYLLNPDEIAWVKFIWPRYLRFGYLMVGNFKQ